MRWVRKSDTFILSRDEACNLLLFNLAWMFVPKKERPCGYAELHKNTLIPLDRLLLQYLPGLVRKLRRGSEKQKREGHTRRVTKQTSHSNRVTILSG